MTAREVHHSSRPGVVLPGIMRAHGRSVPARERTLTRPCASRHGSTSVRAKFGRPARDVLRAETRRRRSREGRHWSPGVGALPAGAAMGHHPCSYGRSIGACTHLGYLPLIGGQSDPPRLSMIRRLFKRSGCACDRDIVVVLAKDFCRFANE